MTKTNAHSKCPLPSCSAPAFFHEGDNYVCCSQSRCVLAHAHFAPSVWEEFPRINEEAQQIAADLREWEYADDALHCDDIASFCRRIEALTEPQAQIEKQRSEHFVLAHRLDAIAKDLTKLGRLLRSAKSLPCPCGFTAASKGMEHDEDCPLFDPR